MIQESHSDKEAAHAAWEWLIYFNRWTETRTSIVSAMSHVNVIAAQEILLPITHFKIFSTKPYGFSIMVWGPNHK